MPSSETCTQKPYFPRTRNTQRLWCYCCWSKAMDAVIWQCYITLSDFFFIPPPPRMTWVRSNKLSVRPSRPIEAPAEMNVCVKRGDPGRSSCRSGRRDCHSLEKMQLAICSISTTPLAVCYANCSKGKKTNKQTHIAAQTNILSSCC